MAQDEQIKSDYFGIDNVRNMPPCLDLRLPDSTRKALPYSYIMELIFESGNEIQIIATTKRIKITGRNLDLLFDYLVAYRVRYVRTHAGVDVVEDGVLVVKEILIEEV